MHYVSCFLRSLRVTLDSMFWFDPHTANAINGLLGALLAGLMTLFWAQHSRNMATLHWMLAAWSMVLATLSYFLRPYAGAGAMFLIGSVLTTCSLLFLLVGVRRFLALPSGGRIAVGVGLCHLVALVCSAALVSAMEATLLINSLFWLGITTAAIASLTGSCPRTWKDWYGFPVSVLGLHAAFHALRLVFLCAILCGIHPVGAAQLLSFSFVETGVFSVALFISLLVSDLRERNRELQTAADEVRKLSGLLPICSSCKKIKDDSGYWTKLETFISDRSGAQFSHGLCPECAVNLYPGIFQDTLPLKLGSEKQPERPAAVAVSPSPVAKES